MSKKAIVIGAVVLFIVLGGVGVYIAWRINTAKQVTPEESAASECSVSPCHENNCCNWVDYGTCETEQSWTDGYNDCVAHGCDNCNRADGEACTLDMQCADSGVCTDGICGTGGGGGGGEDGSACDADSDCQSNHCSNGVCASAEDCNCRCESYGTCGGDLMNCVYDNYTVPTGMIAMCEDHCHATYHAYDAGNCDACGTECDQGATYCPAGTHLVYDGVDPNCGGSCPVGATAYPYNIDCSLCGNPTGCVAYCAPDTPTCPNGTLEGDEECEQGNPVGHVCDWGSDECQDDCSCTTTQPSCQNGDLVNGAECVKGYYVANDFGYPTDDQIECNWRNEEGPNIPDDGGRICDQATCLCSVPTSPQSLQIQGRVYCLDDQDELYPVEGATINLFKGALNQTVSVGTDTNGYYSFDAELTEGGFAVRFGSLPTVCIGGTCQLANGWPMASMIGPSLGDASKCCDTGCPCGVGNPGSCAYNYEWCTGMTEGVNAGYNWVFTNCSETPPEIPGWEMTKVGNPVCFNENTEDVYAEITYTITVTNTVGGGTLSSVVDDYDDNITSDMIVSTTPTATAITSDTITWTLDDSVEEGESVVLSYTVRIPKALLGTQLFNEAKATVIIDAVPTDIFVSESVFALCGLPETGIFDNIAIRIGLGVLLVVLAFAYFKLGLFENVSAWFVKGSDRAAGAAKSVFTQEGKKNRWENRMIRNAERRRRK